VNSINPVALRRFTWQSTVGYGIVRFSINIYGKAEARELVRITVLGYEYRTSHP